MAIQLSNLALESLRRAAREVGRLGHDAIRPEHILLGVLSMQNGSASAAFEAVAIDRVALRSQLEDIFPPVVPAGRSGEVPYHPTAMTVLEDAKAAAEGSRTISTARLFLAAVASAGAPVRDAFTESGVNITLVSDALEARVDDPE